MYRIEWALNEESSSRTFCRYYDMMEGAVMAQSELLRCADYLGIQGQLQVGEVRHDPETVADIGRVYRIP